MDQYQLLHNLEVPHGKIDVVLDTDAYNEIDDQFAISYMLRSPEKLNVRAVFAAPFFNAKSTSPEDGMERSYDEILKILHLAGADALASNVYRGSRGYLPNEKEPVDSPAARALVSLSAEYSTEHPLYVVAIGAITNIASALLMDPTLKEKIVLVWLGGNSIDSPDNAEFNRRTGRLRLRRAARTASLPRRRLFLHSQRPGAGILAGRQESAQRLSGEQHHPRGELVRGRTAVDARDLGRDRRRVAAQ